VLYAQPDVSQSGQRGRRRKYGKRLESLTGWQSRFGKRPKLIPSTFTVNTGMYALMTLWSYWKHSKAPGGFWVFRKTQSVAMFTTDLMFSVTQVIEYYGARWKIELGFKELKQDIGIQTNQCRNA
jgi:IS4 transposase